MGLGNSKDKNIDIFVEVDKPIYMTGEIVSGTIYINCKEQSNYVDLFVEIQGEERIYWSEGSGKNRRTYSNHKTTYQFSQKIFSFQERFIPQSHHAFPFKLLLPQSLSGTYYESSNRHIRYLLGGALTPSDQKGKKQLYQIGLNILQPLRAPFGSTSLQKNFNPKCCGCCMDYGNVVVGITTDKNYVRPTDIVQVNGMIDNTNGKKEIKDVQINFVHNRVMISSGGRVNHHAIQKYTLFNGSKVIPKGTQESVNTSITIPNGEGLKFSTAIGSCTARYFTIELTSEVGCCAMSTKSSVHVVFHSSSPSIEKPQAVPPPQNWNPMYHQQSQVMNLHPYVYSPLTGIPVHNRFEMNQYQNNKNQFVGQTHAAGGYFNNGGQYEYQNNSNNLNAMNNDYTEKEIAKKEYF